MFKIIGFFFGSPKKAGIAGVVAIGAIAITKIVCARNEQRDLANGFAEKTK